MITGQLRNQIDQLWEKFWTGGITNPLTVIEQISFLMFARLLDIQETNNERVAARSGRPFKRLFPEDPDGQLLRWQNFRHLAGKDMLKHVKTNVFPHFAKVTLADTDFGEYMRDADMEIKSESLLVAAVEMIEKLPLTAGDTKGDLYEYLLSKLTTAGINGQFRTPRHIIALMVEMTAPTPKDVICDPACGTCGFLVAAREYMMRLRANSDRMRLEVCIALLQTDDVKRQILGRAKNAVNQSSINQGDVKGILLPLPTMEAQRAFRQAMRAIEVTRTRLHGGVSASSTLFSSLQSRAFSGQI